MLAEELEAIERQRDLRTCGCSLANELSTRFAQQGAHDPTPTRYFVLEELFARLSLTPASRVLDVGCGSGRAMAYFAEAGFPGRMAGVELDPELAAFARAWASRHQQLSVIEGSVLDIPLGSYTDFYLFNPFDHYVLEQFVEKLESEARGPITLCHMSDNGDNYLFMGRNGWKLVDEDWIQYCDDLRVYCCPQHWSIWRYERP